MVEGVCRDPDDDKLPRATLSTEADDVVSGDRDPQVLERYQDVRMLSARTLVVLLEKPNHHGSRTAPGRAFVSMAKAPMASVSGFLGPRPQKHRAPPAA